MTLDRYVDYWAKTRGDMLALVQDAERLTWAQVNVKTTRLAACFQSLGVRQNDRVACLLENSIDWCVVYYAALVAGAIFVPINPRFGKFELEQIASDADCAVVVSTPSQIGLLGGDWRRFTGEGEQIVLFANGITGDKSVNLDQAYLYSGSLVPATSDANATAVLGYTSGTTGAPKGVMLSHRAITASLLSQARACGWTGDDKFLVLSTLAFTGGYLVSLSPALLLGGCAYIENSPDVVRALSLITNEGVSVVQAVPTLWSRMAELPDFASADLSGITSATTGGAPVPVSLLQRYHAKGVVIRQGYACTESCGTACTSFPSLALSHPALCGPSLPSIELITASDSGEVCSPGEVGEIWIRGEQVMDGYWNNPEATAEAVVDGWFKTGDAGRLDENGFLEVVDRKKNMLISGGVNIYPAEVERAMAAILPGAELVVFGVRDAQWGERAVAVIHSSGTLDLDLDQLKRDCRELLGAYKAPREFVASIEPLPRTATGKFARKELPDFYERCLASSSRRIA